MMELLLPLGLLGLLGIIALIIIYIIKPNFQQKFVSSTFVWKLSLKYKKRRIPISKLRNLLLILCQVLILTSCALILSKPVIKEETPLEYSESILIIDSSAGMRAKYDEKTRFERAVDEAITYSQSAIERGNIVTVILATDTPSYLIQKSKDLNAIKSSFDDAKCSYDTADINGAIDMANTILQENPDSEIVLYTATTYLNNGIVNVVNVAAEGEWNAAILDCATILEENSYVFEIDVACYDRPIDLMLELNVVGANNYNNGQGTTITMQVPVRCDVDAAGKAITSTVMVRSVDYGQPKIASYDQVYVTILDANDSFEEDNGFYIYGGIKEPLKVQVWSSDPNSFFYNALSTMQDRLRANRDISLVQVDMADQPAVEGFDFYIFEHELPKSVLVNGLPQDGAVLLSDPDRTILGLDLSIGETVRLDDLQMFSAGVIHPITSYVDPQRFGVTQYKRIVSNYGFEELLYCGNDPVLLVKNDVYSKVAVMPFSVNMSTFPNSWDFMIILYNMIDYFCPLTTTQFVFDVNETVNFKAKGSSFSIRNPRGELLSSAETNTGETITTEFTEPGTYTLTQTSIKLNEDIKMIFIKVPSSESNIFQQGDVLTHIQINKDPDLIDVDLLLYFALALVALAFIEWWLQLRENF